MTPCVMSNIQVFTKYKENIDIDFLLLVRDTYITWVWWKHLVLLARLTEGQGVLYNFIWNDFFPILKRFGKNLIHLYSALALRCKHSSAARCYAILHWHYRCIISRKQVSTAGVLQQFQNGVVILNSWKGSPRPQNVSCSCASENPLNKQPLARRLS